MNLNSGRMLVALAGQPNCGKSSIFNMITGSRQTVANFPGVTVEKKCGHIKQNNLEVEIVDLPGAYSMTSYTNEERIARDFLLRENPDLVVAIADASNIDRSLFFVFQLMEMNKPIALCLNMMDVAVRRGIMIDTDKLSSELGIPVISTIASKGIGKEDLKALLTDTVWQKPSEASPFNIDYGPAMEDAIRKLEARLSLYDSIKKDYPLRWLSIKIMENDPEADKIVAEYDDGTFYAETLTFYIKGVRNDYAALSAHSPEKAVAAARYAAAAGIAQKAITCKSQNHSTLTDQIDSVILHPVWAPVFLVIVLFIIYQTVMVLGTLVADHIFPYWQHLQTIVAGLTPPSNDLIRDGLFKSMIVDGLLAGVVSILYYVPLFLVLFAMLAILEDSGYMARIAFIMDRILRYFGLHGQSTLPLLLGGAIVGGCAVPATIATRTIRDDKARLITILVMPLMNCMAKTPIYILIVGLFFAAHQGLVMLSLSVFGFAVALIVAKALNRYMTFGEISPFIMELPSYHMPTLRGVMTRTIERTWLFVKRIVVIIAPIMVGVWFFITFPGVGFQNELRYDSMALEQYSKLTQTVGPNNPYSKYLAPGSLQDLIRFQERFKTANRKALDGALDEDTRTKFNSENQDFFLIVNKGTSIDGDKDENAATVFIALQSFDKSIRKISRERKKEIIKTSWAGKFGQSLEPVSQLAGFNWQMNIAIISSFAAKESLVGTLGTILSVQGGKEEKSLSEAMVEQGPWTLWHALAILVFVAMFPPCVATLIVIRNETGSNAWTAFASLYPIALGFAMAVCVFQVGQFV